MLRKMLLGLLFAASFSAFAFDKDECETIAVNLYNAQAMLNDNPAEFAAVSKQLELQPAEAMQWTEKMKKAILGMAATLKPGADPQQIGMAVYKACVNTKEI